MIIRDVTLDEASLTRFFGAFNTRVRGNALIRPVFAAVIREPDWPRHMATIQATWSSVLFKTCLYKCKSFGYPVILDSLESEHFLRWLDLIEEIASVHFLRDIAAILIDRAHCIGDCPKAGMFFRPGLSYACETG